MSDNLLEKLHNWGKVYPEDEDKPDGSLYLEAADCIEELEARVAELEEALDEARRLLRRVGFTDWDEEKPPKDHKQAVDLVLLRGGRLMWRYIEKNSKGVAYENAPVDS